MPNQIARRKWFLFLAILLTAASVITGAAISGRRQRAQNKVAQQEPRVTSMPLVFSKVKELEVVRAWIVRQDTEVPGASIEIKNNSDKDALAVQIMCGDGSITRNGLHDDDHPTVILKAHDTIVMEMSFGEMTFGAPLVVSAVTWADGSQEGDEESLKIIHGIREHYKAMKRQNSAATRKEAPTP